ncbi:hypothetical protein MMC09_003467 [Bachmanniomyces sp. S44760]|nr:hypothetical protein [Bachmanniomyces sp. S44760]
MVKKLASRPFHPQSQTFTNIHHQSQKLTMHRFQKSKRKSSSRDARKKELNPPTSASPSSEETSDSSSRPSKRARKITADDEPIGLRLPKEPPPPLRGYNSRSLRKSGLEGIADADCRAERRIRANLEDLEPVDRALLHRRKIIDMNSKFRPPPARRLMMGEDAADQNFHYPPEPAAYKPAQQYPQSRSEHYAAADRPAHRVEEFQFRHRPISSRMHSGSTEAAQASMSVAPLGSPIGAPYDELQRRSVSLQYKESSAENTIASLQEGSVRKGPAWRYSKWVPKKRESIGCVTRYGSPQRATKARSTDYTAGVEPPK